MNELDKIAMEKAIKESKINIKNHCRNGGPFGATIVKNGKIISTAHNTVVETKDATAHAEINAIRIASEKLNTHDLTRMCIIYKCRALSYVFICDYLVKYKRSLLCQYQRRCR